MSSESTLHVNIQLARRDRGFSLDVQFEVASGVTILFGPSGSGKSTTLAAIAGLVRPDSGRISLGEQTWFAPGIELAPEARGLAIVFQSLALFPHMSALANVEYGIDRAHPKAFRKTRALAMLERMRVPHLADRKPRTFSGGEAQRVALARAFARAPRIVLLDEAFSAMDRDLRVELLRDVRHFAAESHVPVLLVTHHRNEARAMGDRAILFEHGRVVRQGSVDAILPQTPPDGHDHGRFDELDKTPWPAITIPTDAE